MGPARRHRRRGSTTKERPLAEHRRDRVHRRRGRGGTPRACASTSLGEQPASSAAATVPVRAPRSRSSEVDHAQRRELGHSRGGDPPQRLLGIQRGVQRGRGGNQEPQPPALLPHALEGHMDRAGRQEARAPLRRTRSHRSRRTRSRRRRAPGTRGGWRGPPAAPVRAAGTPRRDRRRRSRSGRTGCSRPPWRRRGSRSAQPPTCPRTTPAAARRGGAGPPRSSRQP